VLLEIWAPLLGLTDGEGHIITVHGYYYNDDPIGYMNYLIVNNGWGSNNVWLDVEGATTVGDILYIS
jgi:hypothetical protein